MLRIISDLTRPTSLPQKASPRSQDTSLPKLFKSSANKALDVSNSIAVTQLQDDFYPIHKAQKAKNPNRDKAEECKPQKEVKVQISINNEALQSSSTEKPLN